MTRKETQNLHAKLAGFIKRHPQMTYTEMSTLLQIPVPTLSSIGVKAGIRRMKTPAFQVTPALLAKLEE